MDATELAFAGAARQAELVREREVSARELVDASLERIARIDPELNSFRIVFADAARDEAKRLDRRRSRPERPLSGVPVAVKDNLDVAGVVTAHGSRAYGATAGTDAEIVHRLREAGAILIGKTNMPELAIFPWTESAALGATRNPWDTGRSAGGSSGGSAAAAAAGLVGVASASDGGGSIRIPAACCGLFGLKPQVGRVPLTPDDDHWHGLSAAGAVSRSVADTAVFLDAVAEPTASGRSFVDSARSDPGRLRIAVSFKPSGLARVDPRVRAAVQAVADVLAGLGHTVEHADPAYGRLEPAFIPRWLRGIHDDAASMAQPERLERRTRIAARLGGLISDDLLRRARDTSAERSRRIAELFERYDVLVTPVMPAPPDPVGRYEGRGWTASVLGAAQQTVFTIPWNVTGQPAASVPAPADDSGVPLAAELIGRPHDEATLLAVSAQLERETAWTDRRPAVD